MNCHLQLSVSLENDKWTRVRFASLILACCMKSLLSVTHNNGKKKVVDKLVTVCKHCATHVADASGNTCSMMNHLRGHHHSVPADSQGEESRVGNRNPSSI